MINSTLIIWSKIQLMLLHQLIFDHVNSSCWGKLITIQRKFKCFSSWEHLNFSSFRSTVTTWTSWRHVKESTRQALNHDPTLASVRTVYLSMFISCVWRLRWCIVVYTKLISTTIQVIWVCYITLLWRSHQDSFAIDGNERGKAPCFSIEKYAFFPK